MAELCSVVAIICGSYTTVAHVRGSFAEQCIFLVDIPDFFSQLSLAFLSPQATASFQICTCALTILRHFVNISPESSGETASDYMASLVNKKMVKSN